MISETATPGFMGRIGESMRRHAEELGPGPVPRRITAVAGAGFSITTRLPPERQVAWRTLGGDLLRLLDGRGNGLVVAFYPYASNLLPDDTNNTPDVFVRDRTGSTSTDTTPPVLALPGPVTVEATAPAGTTVECTAIDAAGNQATGSFTVTLTAAEGQPDDPEAPLPGHPLEGLVETSLANKVTGAQDTVAAADTRAACARQSGFLNQAAGFGGAGKPVSAQVTELCRPGSAPRGGRTMSPARPEAPEVEKAPVDQAGVAAAPAPAAEETVPSPAPLLPTEPIADQETSVSKAATHVLLAIAGAGLAGIAALLLVRHFRSQPVTAKRAGRNDGY